MDIEHKSNKRKPLVSLTSDDSTDNDYEHQHSLSSWSNMTKRTRKTRTASTAKAQSVSRTRRANGIPIAKKPAVNTSNSYAILTDNDEENVVDNNITSRKTKAVKIPPIVCIDAKYNDMMNLIKASKIEDFSLKYISMGIKVFCTTLADFETVRNTLKNNQVQHFTHDVSSSKSQKFVLSGLPNFPIEDVKTALQQENLGIIDVKKMKIRSENENYALFLVYFNNNSTTLQCLRKVKYILNVAVGWKPYQQARNGPTQCNNCQLYGHGNKNCLLQPRCAKCGGKHQTSICLRNQQPQPEVSFIAKCCLCGGQHSSKDRNCPKRLNYINMKLNQSQAALTRSSNTKNRPQPPPQPTRNITSQNSSSAPVTVNKKYSDWFKPTHRIEVNVQPPDELLSNDLLTEMMIELFQGLRASKTRLDQIQTVASVVLKYSTINNNV